MSLFIIIVSSPKSYHSTSQRSACFTFKSVGSVGKSMNKNNNFYMPLSAGCIHTSILVRLHLKLLFTKASFFQVLKESGYYHAHIPPQMLFVSGVTKDNRKYSISQLSR